MSARLDGKVCVITGAGGGMGREAALLFCSEGAKVCAADVDGEAANQTAGDAGEAFAVQVDVADEASVQEMYARTAATYLSRNSPAAALHVGNMIIVAYELSV